MATISSQQELSVGTSSEMSLSRSTLTWATCSMRLMASCGQLLLVDRHRSTALLLPAVWKAARETYLLLRPAVSALDLGGAALRTCVVCILPVGNGKAGLVVPRLLSSTARPANAV